jgi:hypothetical protein
MKLDETARELVLRVLAERFGEEGAAAKIVRVLRCAPFNMSTWRHLDTLSPELRESYWRHVHPRWDKQAPDELREIIDQLLAVDRPKAAMNIVHLEWAAIDSERLIRLLREVATSSAESHTIRPTQSLI